MIQMINNRKELQDSDLSDSTQLIGKMAVFSIECCLFVARGVTLQNIY